MEFGAWEELGASANVFSNSSSDSTYAGSNAIAHCCTDTHSCSHSRANEPPSSYSAADTSPDTGSYTP